MTYQVLARKWRPRNFAALVGQEHVVRALTHALEQQRLHHAYLFTGTRGVGKTTLARILAKALNCETGITPTPCGKCAACLEIDAGRFVDLIEVDAATNTRVDEMRQLLDNAVYAPTRGRFKVYVIDEVHMLSNSAFNAMLKTLEEPPEHIKFILATTDPQKIPVTVLSRCLQFNLKQMPAAVIAAHLERVLAEEGVPAEAPALRLVAHAARGSMRDALSLRRPGDRLFGRESRGSERPRDARDRRHRPPAGVARGDRAARRRRRARDRRRHGGAEPVVRERAGRARAHPPSGRARASRARCGPGGHARSRADPRARPVARSGGRAALLPDRAAGPAGPAARAGRVRRVHDGADADARVRTGGAGRGGERRVGAARCQGRARRRLLRAASGRGASTATGRRSRVRCASPVRRSSSPSEASSFRSRRTRSSWRSGPSRARSRTRPMWTS